jgi:hypothetical protein
MSMHNKFSNLEILLGIEYLLTEKLLLLPSNS